VGRVRNPRHSKRGDVHAADCNCARCAQIELNVRVTKDGELELSDPDTMEDEGLPYFWNRHQQP